MNQKGFANIVFIVVLVVLLAGTVGYTTLVKKPSTSAPTTQTSPSENVSSEKYIDGDSGFQFNFPSSWKIVNYKTGLKNSPESVSIIKSPDFNQVVYEGEEPFYELKQGAEITVYVQVSPSAKTIKDLQEFNKLGRGGPAYINERFIKVDGKNALLYDIPYRESSGHFVEFLNNNRWIRIFIVYKGIENKKIFDNILSTLKFTTTTTSQIPNTPQSILDRELPSLVKSTILINKYFVEFDSAKNYTVWLYTKSKPTAEQVKVFVTILGTSLTEKFPGPYVDFNIFPESSTKIPYDNKPFDTYFNVAWRNGEVMFPVN